MNERTEYEIGIFIDQERWISKATFVDQQMALAVAETMTHMSQERGISDRIRVRVREVQVERIALGGKTIWDSDNE